MHYIFFLLEPHHELWVLLWLCTEVSFSTQSPLNILCEIHLKNSKLYI